MSRIGNKVIVISSGVKVDIKGQLITIDGPKGKLTYNIHSDITVSISDGKIFVKRPTENKLHKSLHGVTRANISNMIDGVTVGFQKTLAIIGIGFKAFVENDKFTLQVGFTHPVVFNIPQGITIKVEKQTAITLSGSDKQLLGEFTAKIRAVRPPEPYKGTGIRYTNEYVRKKVGKAAITAGTGGK
ncbi:MAG: 50S ribosomal protein L6 [Candidatus Firestonebacteria bacterium]